MSSVDPSHCGFNRIFSQVEAVVTGLNVVVDPPSLEETVVGVPEPLEGMVGIIPKSSSKSNVGEAVAKNQ